MSTTEYDPVPKEEVISMPEPGSFADPNLSNLIVLSKRKTSSRLLIERENSVKSFDLSGLTEEEVINSRELHGKNALDRIEVFPFFSIRFSTMIYYRDIQQVSLWWILFSQFTGLMPYMLEIAAILALAVEDWVDFAIIAAIVLCNAFVGFTEELKAKHALESLTSSEKKTIVTYRRINGAAVHDELDITELVVGDIIHLEGGKGVPADVMHVKGDVLNIDTAALTGEPLPRKYPSEENHVKGSPHFYDPTILGGCIVAQGEAYCRVVAVGANSEMGKGNDAILKDKAKKKTSVFEQRILLAVQILIFVSLADVVLIFLIQGFARREFYTTPQIQKLVLTCLSIIIASIPVALPLVLQVTMALGASSMAREHNAVVTSLPALQDISSMSILCSDKTGTLTTAKMTIISDEVWATAEPIPVIKDDIRYDYSLPMAVKGFTKEELAMYGALSSNRAKAEDPIDRAVLSHFDKMCLQEIPSEVIARVPKEIAERRFLEEGGMTTKVLEDEVTTEARKEEWKNKQRSKWYQDEALRYMEARNFHFHSNVGFDPKTKRVVWYYSYQDSSDVDAEDSAVIVAKGLTSKILSTTDGGKDNGEEQWEVEDYENLKKVVMDMDHDYSDAGYKTIAVAIHRESDGLNSAGNKIWKFVGILPMMDPERIDTKQTITRLNEAGVEVKMITGDHLNIAKTTAKKIGLGHEHIQKGEMARFTIPDECYEVVTLPSGVEVKKINDKIEIPIPEATRKIIREAHGFAQVLPDDKRTVVLSLRQEKDEATGHPLVIGMTGDGANDAPALSAAQCGVAVHGATDAAKNAAAIILTHEGLSPIYSAVVESRRIFRKLKSYVTYRFAASIQIVTILTLIIYISDCPIESLYIILLALFNDLTMLPIAYDNQKASMAPDTPEVDSILALSAIFGVLETAFSLLWIYAAGQTGIFRSDFMIQNGCSKQVQAGLWVQMSVASEILIFSARAPAFIHQYEAPALSLVISVFIGCLIISILATQVPFFGSLAISDVVIIWIYDSLCLIVIDAAKVAYLTYTNTKNEVLPEWELIDKENADKASKVAAVDSNRLETNQPSSRV